jgi:hypothetical protein
LVDITVFSANGTRSGHERETATHLTLDRLLIAASHSHAGLEGFSLDRPNVANNPRIG